MEHRHNEQGEIVSFLVVALALSALLVGGIFLMKHQARVARNDVPSVAVNEQTRNEQSSNNTDATSKNETNNDTQQSQSGTKPAAPATQSTPSAATPSQQSTAPTAAPRTGPSQVVNTGPSYSYETVSNATIPSTGIEDVFAPLFAVGGLGVGIYLFSESQRKIRATALK